MASSIAKTIEDNGYDASDENIDTLVDSLKSSFKKSVYDNMSSKISYSSNRMHEIPELDILFNRPPVNINNVTLGYNKGGYIIFGKPYGGYAIQHGYTYVDTVGYANKIVTVTVTFPIAFTELYGINLTYRDSALSTNNLERTIYFVSSAGSYSSGSTTSFVLANHSEYASGHNSYWWTAFGKI